MTNNIAHKFINRNGAFNSKAAMQAGHEARTDGLRTLIETATIFLKSCMQVGNFKHFLTNLKT